MTTLDIFWILTSSALVLIMQAGFLCIEAGLTRSRNSIHVATKALVSFGVSSLAFWIFGYGIIYSQSIHGLIGTVIFGFAFQEKEPSHVAFIVYQVLFCVTTATILSGAIAERAKFNSFLILTAVVAVMIYPPYSHWVNNGIPFGTPAGWLTTRGFVDLAGGSFVHSIGGWASLAALLIIGPRTGRFGPNGEIRPIVGSNLPFAILGVLLFFFGWLGFNGGSTYTLDSRVPSILAHTLLAGLSGLLFSSFLSFALLRRIDVIIAINGALTGLASITACAHVVSPQASIAIGAIGALIGYLIDQLLMKFKIDDAVSAVSVHVGGGSWGLIAAALFGDPVRIQTGLGFFQQLMIQFIGALSAFAWGFGASLILFWLLNRFIKLRVSPEDEKIGLNLSEHGAHNEWADLLNNMIEHSKTGNMGQRIIIEPFTDAGIVAQYYNSALEAFETASAESKLNAKKATLGTMAAGIAHEINNPVSVIQGRANQLTRLCDRTPLPVDTIKEISHDIEITSNRIVDIVASLRTIGGIGRRKFHTNHALESVVSEVKKLTETVFIDSTVKMIWEEIPDRIRDEIFLGNRVEVCQILINLITNARDAVRHFSEPWVKLTITLDDDALEIHVDDSGPGIPLELQDKIFEPFYSTKGKDIDQKSLGMGLGLALSRAFAEDHGGSLTLNRASKNTRFTLRLPRHTRKDQTNFDYEQQTRTDRG